MKLYDIVIFATFWSVGIGMLGYMYVEWKRGNI